MGPTMVLRAHDDVRTAPDLVNTDRTAVQTAPASFGCVLAYAG